MLLGPPGSGKSTCLERLTLDLIRAYRKDPANEYIPIFCSLARWKNKRLTALDFLKQAVQQLTGPKNRLTYELEDYLANGRLVVIFDGLNEMPGRTRPSSPEAKEPEGARKRDLTKKLAGGQILGNRFDRREESVRELARSRGVRSRFVIACRTHEFSGSMDWKRVHILPLDDDQIAQFLGTYLPKRAGELTELLKEKPALFELSRNPFYLYLLTQIGEQDLRHVENRGQFLKLLLDTLLGREAQRRGDAIDVERFERQFGVLATTMIDQDMIGSQVDAGLLGLLDEDVADLGVGTGLVVRSSEGELSFYHQLIQEFFAALAIERGYVRRSLQSLVREEKWRETLVLHYDVSKSPKATASSSGDCSSSGTDSN